MVQVLTKYGDECFLARKNGTFVIAWKGIHNVLYVSKWNVGMFLLVSQAYNMDCLQSVSVCCHGKVDFR